MKVEKGMGNLGETHGSGIQPTWIQTRSIIYQRDVGMKFEPLELVSDSVN